MEMDDAQSAGSSLFVITLCGSRENNWLVDFLWVVDKHQLCLIGMLFTILLFNVHLWKHVRVARYRAICCW